MPRPKPYNPALAEYQRQQKADAEAERRDRKATDLLRNAIVSPLEIDNPINSDDERRIVAMRSLRDDPLARMHDRRLIDDASYHGGRAYQGDFEKAEQGPQAIDPSREYVDGGKPPDPLPEARAKAVDRLKDADERLGQKQGATGVALLRDFLIAGMSMEQICAARLDFSGTRDRLYIGRRIRECLNELAVIYGFATGAGHETVR